MRKPTGQQSSYDLLFSGLQNQLSFIKQVGERRASRSLYLQHNSLILGAIDQLDDVLNRYGHSAGEWVRAAVITTVRQVLRAADFLTPIEGDSFVIGLPNTPLTGATAVAERLRSLVQKKGLTYEDAELSFTLSVGVVTIHPCDSFESLKGRLYQVFSLAYRLGGNQVRTESDVLAETDTPSSR